jgi:hypothetical protein
VADPKLAAFAIAGALNWIGHWFRAGRSLSAEHVAEAFVQFLELGLAPRQPELSADTTSARRKRPSPRP